MAQLPGTVCVIGLQYIVPHAIDIIFVRKGSGSLLITDINHKKMFMVKNCETKLHKRRVLVDAANMEHPIATLQNKVRTAHDKWQVFRGDSTDKSNLIFGSKTPHLLQFKTKLNVYLAGNNKKDSCDFRLEGSWSDKSCKIYLGSSSTIIAQMYMKRRIKKKKHGKDKFMVTIYPNVDCAFIVAVFAIIDALKSSHMDVAKLKFDVAINMATEVVTEAAFNMATSAIL